jgi:hypothetical protein
MKLSVSVTPLQAYIYIYIPIYIDTYTHSRNISVSVAIRLPPGRLRIRGSIVGGTDTQGLEMLEAVMSSAGLGTKNDCDGESQQQFNRPTVLFIAVK